MQKLFTEPKKAMEGLQGKFDNWYESILAFLPDLLLAIVTMIGFVVIANLLYRWTREACKKLQFAYEMSLLIANIVYLIVIGVGLFVSLGILNLDKTVTSLLAGAGIAGLAISLAFQNLATNFLSGIIISMRRPIAVGDIIESNDYYGTVHVINWRTTHLITFEGQYVHIPNKEMIENPVVNYTKFGRRRVDIRGRVSYAEDLENVRSVALTAMEDIPNRLYEFPPEVYFEEFDDSSINFVARFWIPFGRETPNRNYKAAFSEGMIHIRKAFKREDITIPYPIKTLDFGVKGGERFAEILDQNSFHVNRHD